jgi:hypothetical protein
MPPFGEYDTDKERQDNSSHSKSRGIATDTGEVGDIKGLDLLWPKDSNQIIHHTKVEDAHEYKNDASRLTHDNWREEREDLIPICLVEAEGNDEGDTNDDHGDASSRFPGNL